MSQVWPNREDTVNIFKSLQPVKTVVWVIKSYKYLQVEGPENFTWEVWEHFNQYVTETVVLQRETGMYLREVWSACMSVGLLGFHFMACWWGWHRYGFTTVGRARSHCWQQVLFDVDVQCWVSVLASTYDLHYDQRRNACWRMTGDYGQRGERRGGRDGG